jgi:hypothetical protein
MQASIATLTANIREAKKLSREDMSKRMQEVLRTAKPQFTEEQLALAAKLTPKHLFQGADIGPK